MSQGLMPQPKGARLQAYLSLSLQIRQLLQHAPVRIAFLENMAPPFHHTSQNFHHHHVFQHHMTCHTERLSLLLLMELMTKLEMMKLEMRLKPELDDLKLLLPDPRLRQLHPCTAHRTSTHQVLMSCRLHGLHQVTLGPNPVSNPKANGRLALASMESKHLVRPL